MARAGAAALGLLLCAAAAPSNRERAAAVPVLAGAPALRDLLQGHADDDAPLVLHFWATWCPECVREAPALGPLFERAEKRGARVLLFSLDAPSDAPAVARFLARHALRQNAWVLDAADPDPVARLIDPAWKGDLPATFVFRRGKRVSSIIGRTSGPGLDRALRGRAPAPR